MPGLSLGLGLGLNSYGGINPFNIETDFFASALPAYLNFSRASVATDLINGVLTDFAVNAPRISPYNGFLNEIASTNNIRNGEAQGSTVGAIGSDGSLPTNWNQVNTVGLTVEVVGKGTVNGFNYIDLKLSGTPSAGTYSLLFDSALQIPAASGDVWTGSVWAGLIAGALTNISSMGVRVSERAAGVEVAGATTNFTPTINPTRFRGQRVFNNAGTTHAIHQIDIVVTAAAVNCTLRISSPQLEAGYDLTSYIRTTGAAATRAIDVCYALSSAINYNDTEGTFVVAGVLGNSYLGASPRTMFAAISQENNKNAVTLRKAAYGGTGFEAIVLNNYVSDGNILFGTVSGGYSPFIAAMRYQLNNVGVCKNGTGVSSDTTVPMPTGISAYRVYLGQSRNSANNLNGYITGFKYSRLALTDAQLLAEVA